MSRKKLSLKEIEDELRDLYDNASSKAFDNNEMVKIYKADLEEGVEFMYEEYKRRRLWYIAQEDAFSKALNLFTNMRRSDK